MADPVHLKCALPFSSVVRATPPETLRAAKKIQEAKAPIDETDFRYIVEEGKVDIDEALWIRTVRKNLNDARPKQQPNGPTTIFKVPQNIRRCDAKAYDPLVVSIGPYHYRPSQRGTALAMQDHKWQCVRYLLSRHRSQHRASKLLDICLAELKELDAKVRSCYSERIYNLDPQKLAIIMFLDGCFIIHLLLKQLEKEPEREVKVVVKEEMEGKGKMAEMQEEREEEMGVATEEEPNKEKDDMFVLEVVDRNKVEQNNEDEEIVVLEVGEEEEEIEGPLLGMLWIRNLVEYDLLKLENQIPFFIVQRLFNLLKTPDDENIDLVKLALQLFSNIHPNKSEAFKHIPGYQIHHLLHLFHSSLVPSEHRASVVSAQAQAQAEWIPSAAELKMAGVKFEKKEAGSFLDITFRNGVMQIPQLRIYDYSNSLFRNLIAFEQCYPDTKTYITIYSAFMDCIIDTPEDVRLLDLKGILVNRLSTDQAVADLFNQLCNQIHYASDRNYLRDVSIQVKKYHESKWHKWRAGLMRDYFGNPWAIISVVAAVFLLILTIVQSFFAAYSYFYPP